MIITATDSGFELHENDDFSRLHVDANGRSASELTDLATEHVSIIPIIDSEHLWVSTKFLRGDEADEERESQLERLVGYADEHGWYDRESEAVRAHITNLRD